MSSRARTLILRDTSDEAKGIESELGHYHAHTLGVVNSIDQATGTIQEIVQGYPQPRNWHYAIRHKKADASGKTGPLGETGGGFAGEASKPGDGLAANATSFGAGAGTEGEAGVGVLDARIGVSLIADHENGFLEWRLTSRAESTPFLDDWHAENRSTRMVDYGDPRGRTGLLSQLVKITDDIEGQYVPALVLGRRVGSVAAQPKTDVPQPDPGIETVFIHFVAVGGLVTGAGLPANVGNNGLVGAGGPVTQVVKKKNGKILSAVNYPGLLTQDPADAKPAPGDGQTESKDKAPTPATGGDFAAGGYVWDPAQKLNGILDTFFTINPLDELGKGREKTPCCILSARHDAHFDWGGSHGCILFSTTDIANYSYPDAGTPYKATMAFDSSAANQSSSQDHESGEWRPWFQVPNFRTMCVVEPPPPPPPDDPIQPAVASADGPLLCSSPRRLSASFVAGRGQALLLPLASAAPETAIFTNTGMDTWGLMCMSHDDTNARTAWLADRVGGSSTWRSLLSVRQTCSANDVPHATGATGFAWGTLSALIDSVFSSTRGSILYRGASGWAALGPGTSGQLLKTNGAGADPAWATAAAGGWGGMAVTSRTANGFTAAVNELELCGGAAATSTLPSGVGLAKPDNMVSYRNLTGGNHTVSRAGSDTIEGANTFTLQNTHSVTLISDGANPATWTVAWCC